MYRGGSQQPMNPAMEGLVRLFSQKSSLYIHANQSVEIIQALDFAEKMGLRNVVLISGPEVLEVLGLLKEKNIPVVLNRLHDLPAHADAQVFQAARVPAELQKAGILFALDYEGSMGVPITFLDKYNPDQFDIVGMTSGRDEFEATPTKKYINPKQHNEDGTIINGSKANTSSTIIYKSKPEGVFYTADNADGFMKVLYTRFLIKRKK
jgi:acyl CoA:acetate/3-ketoacid CoA transferase alpha subunit